MSKSPPPSPLSLEAPGAKQDGGEGRIPAAAERTPTHEMASAPRVGHVISLAGNWAMRPQTAMAGVFLVMIATSLLLLRGKSGRAPSSAEVKVTEHGTPASAPCAAAQPATRGYTEGAPLPAAKPIDEARPSELVFDAAMRDYRAGRFIEAARTLDGLPATDPGAPDLWAARAVREAKGCRAAVARFDKAAQRHRPAAAGWDALLEGALCYRALGDLNGARTRLSSLLGVDSHKDRARVEIEHIDQLRSQAPASNQ